MISIYSSIQRNHEHGCVLKQGEHSSSLEVPERIDSILSALLEENLGPVIAPDPLELGPVRAVHDPAMVAFLSTAWEQHQSATRSMTAVFPTFFTPPGQRGRPDCFEGKKGLYCIDMEVPIGEHTWEAALASASCAWSGAIRLRAGENLVYALCRPPGHHAGPDFMAGYCYLNNAAIAAKTLQSGTDRVAILDIDYHHGNGTQAIFWSDPSVCYGSLHVDPRTAYPFFAGYEDEVGSKAGHGTNWNLPLPPGTTQDAYLAALETLLTHVSAFSPRWLVVSAGFDAYVHDPISTFQVTTAGFQQVGLLIRALNKPTVVIQEGGYHIPHLGRNAVAFLNALI